MPRIIYTIDYVSGREGWLPLHQSSGTFDRVRFDTAEKAFAFVDELRAAVFAIDVLCDALDNGMRYDWPPAYRVNCERVP